MAPAAQAQGWRERLSEWRIKFRHYREPPDETLIEAWISRFEEADQELAAKVLDHVTVVSNRDILTGYRTALNGLPGWDRNPNSRQGDRWFFVGFGRAGESGPAMVRYFREGNDLAYSEYDGLFASLSDLPDLRLTANDIVVFIDDFSGSGRQVSLMWPRIAELVASEARCYLLLTALTGKARERIEKSTDLHLIYSYMLGPENALFDELNDDFSPDEKGVIERYCAVADPKWPRGFGSLGILFVLHHKSANNCLPILYVNEERWRGLFPRYLRAG